MGMKSCLFVCYVEHVTTKLWMVEEAMTLNGGLHNRTVEGSIRRRIRKQCTSFFFFHQFQVMVVWAC